MLINMRYGFALFLLEFIMVLILTNQGKVAKNLNEGLWFVKFVLLVGLWALMFTMHPNFFKACLEVAKFLAIVLVLMLIITLVDMAYRWSEAWVKLYEKGAQIIGCMLWAMAILFYGVTVYLTIKNFDWFVDDNPNDCHKERNFIIVAIIFQGLATLLFWLGA